MTVCIAVLFTFNDAAPDAPRSILRGAVVMSDRMITAGDVEYEPRQRKLTQISSNILVLIAGDYPIHSEALSETRKQLRRVPNPLPRNVALIYGRAN